jgi:cobalt-zinc-cadmium efflux system outer membrane protein
MAATLLASIAGGQSPGDATAVDRLIQEAFSRNREILAVEQRVAEARGLLRQAGVRPVPTIETSGGSGRPLGTQGEEQVNVGYFYPIETGGKRSKRMAVAEKGLDLAEVELADRKRQVAYDIKVRYIDAAASKRRVEAVDRIVSVNRESYRLIDARVQRDDAAPLERQLLLVELNRTEAQKAVAGGQAEASAVELRRAVGLPDEQPTILVLSRPGPITTAPTAMQQLALSRRPDLRAARTLELQAGAEIELAEAQGHPDVTVSAQYSRNNSQVEDPIRRTTSGSPLLLQDRDNVLSVGVAIPLQTRKRNLGNIEAATARENAAKLRRQHLEATIPLEVDAAWRRYQAAQRASEILSQGVLEESERNLNVIRQAYNLGQLRLFDVLNEQRRLLETELTYIDAQAELARSRAELERVVGGELK